MNKIREIDYKKPIGAQLDLRTTTNLAHMYINDFMPGTDTKVKIPERHLRDCPVCPRSCLSETKENYTWKYYSPEDNKSPTINANAQLVKECAQSKFINTTGYIAPRISITHESYVKHPIEKREPCVTKPFLASKVPTKKIFIDRSKEGYMKYLDPSATTSNLAYVAHSQKDLDNGIAAHDHITYWTWTKQYNPPRRVFPDKDPTMCNDRPSALCAKRHKEFASTVKRVPNSGMTTETRQSYIDPKYRVLKVEPPWLSPKIICEDLVPQEMKRESSMYGSGEKTQKYV